MASSGQMSARVPSLLGSSWGASVARRLSGGDADGQARCGAIYRARRLRHDAASDYRTRRCGEADADGIAGAAIERAVYVTAELELLMRITSAIAVIASVVSGGCMKGLSRRRNARFSRFSRFVLELRISPT